MPAAATAVTAAIIIAALYFGREVFVPIALAILLSFVLAPLVRLLQRWRIPRGFAVISVVFLAFIAIFALAGVIAIAGERSRRGSAALPIHDATEDTVAARRRGDERHPRTRRRRPARPQQRAQEPGGGDPWKMQPATPGQEARPIPVEVRQPPPTALENVAALIAPLLQPLTTTGISAIFVIFILFQREDLRNRFVKLAGAHDLQRTTVALDDAATRLSRLYLVQLALNAAFGIVIGIGLWVIGVPSPALWGILAAILRFVPYIGAFISAVFPLILAAAVDPGWSMLLWTVALFLIVEPVVGQVIEPLLYGHSTGLSPIAVVASATLWTALWGPVGLILATPLTVCLVVLGRHVERFKFFDVMLGNRPALSPSELFYQRMLAEDPVEAIDQAEEFLKERSLSSYYDEIALPGLRLAQIDVSRKALDRAQTEKIKLTIAEVIEQLADQEDREPDRAKAARDADAAAAPENARAEPVAEVPMLVKAQLAPDWQTEVPVLCVAGRGPLDEAIALMLAQLLNKHGLGTQSAAADTISGANLLRGEAAAAAMVCLSYLDSSSLTHMRYAVRRLRRKLPAAKVIIGCWMRESSDLPTGETLNADAVATTLREALLLCVRAAQDATIASAAEANVVALAASLDPVAVAP